VRPGLLEVKKCPVDRDREKSVNINATRQSDMVSGLLAEYVLGGLSTPARVLVESHLELSPDAQIWLDDVQSVGSALASKAGKSSAPATPHVFDQIEPVAFSDPDGALQAVMDVIEGESRTSRVPAALEPIWACHWPMCRGRR
jgi:anti-sigma factor ChrR (cupin superfamily)